MALTNAEKQAQWRERRETRIKTLERRVADLEAENEQLRNQEPPAINEPLTFPKYYRSSRGTEDITAGQISEWLERELLANRISPWALSLIASNAKHLATIWSTKTGERRKQPLPSSDGPKQLRNQVSRPPPLPKLTREQIGAPSEGTEDEQDPDSPPGVTHAMAFTQKYGHVHIMPLDDRLRNERKRKAISWVAALQKRVSKSHKDYMAPKEFRAVVDEMRERDPKGAALLFRKYEDRLRNLR